MKKNKTTYGTSHFISFPAAVRYYANQGENMLTTRLKIEEKSISIGAPELKKGQKLIINQSEGRYFIEE